MTRQDVLEEIAWLMTTEGAAETIAHYSTLTRDDLRVVLSVLREAREYQSAAHDAPLALRLDVVRRALHAAPSSPARAALTKRAIVLDNA